MSNTYIFTGGRDYKNQSKVFDIMNQFISHLDTVVVGDCPTGLDQFVRDWIAMTNHFNYKIYVADWDKFGRSAGPKRNKKMIDEMYKNSPFTILLAFPGQRGTRNCINNALSKNMMVFNVEEYAD